MIFKIDFEKAFDKVEYSAILEIMRCMGFGNKWIGWIKTIFRSDLAAVLLNGVPGKKIHCKRGVRQGDPLSPQLYVLASELLQYMVNKAWLDGIISLPLDNSFGLKFPIIQYADDTLIILPARPNQLLALKSILEDFTAITGLKVNYGKSSLVPINISEDRCAELAEILTCKPEALPFTYLGLPMGTTKPKLEHFISILERIDRRLCGISNMLSYDGRLTVIKSIVTSIPLFAMCTVKMPRRFLDHVEGSARKFLWRGRDINKKGNCLVKWEQVCKPKKCGGMGVMNLRTQNSALLMKHLYKFMNRFDVPWVQLIWKAHYQNNKLPQVQAACGSFWWKDILALWENFCQLTKCKQEDGRTIRFWKDKWRDVIPEMAYPHLFSFAKKQDINMNQIMLDNQADSMLQHFNLPLSLIAFQQLQEIQTLLNNQNLV